MYPTFTPELFWSNTSIVVYFFFELVLSSVNALLLTQGPDGKNFIATSAWFGLLDVPVQGAESSTNAFHSEQGTGSNKGIGARPTT